MNKKRVVKWWWGWNPSKIESFIESMAKQGWKVDHVSGNSTVFDFVKDKPRTIKVCADYQKFTGAASDYFALFEDDGWECIHQKAGWILWQKPYEGKRPQIYTDTQSLKERNRRIILTLLFGLAAQIPIFVINLNSIYLRVTHWPQSPLALTVLSLYILILVMLIYAIVRLTLANQKLR